MKASDHVAMAHQYADSDSLVNADGACESELRFVAAVTLDPMVEKRSDKAPDPVSEFLRFLIERWQADGRQIKDLARAAGLAQSMPSQIKAGTSNASFYSAAKLAAPFGFRDLPELVTAAYAWWRSPDRSQVPAVGSESPVAEAIRIALTYSVSQVQIDRVLNRLPPDRYAHQDALWWLSRFHEERSLEHEQHSARAAHQRNPRAGTWEIAETGREAKRRRSRTAAAAGAVSELKPRQKSS